MCLSNLAPFGTEIRFCDKYKQYIQLPASNK